MGTPYWDALRAGDAAAGISMLQDQYDRSHHASEAMALGVGYQLIGDFPSAAAHFDDFNERHPKYGSVTYAMAGGAWWCLDDRIEAVHRWSEGVDCKSADSNGTAINVPSLLFFASVVEPDLVRKSEIDALIAQKVGDRRAKGEWLLHIARFVLKQINEDELRRRAAIGDERDRMLQGLFTDFYVGAVERYRGNTDRFGEMMRSAGALSWRDYDTSPKSFFDKPWHPEFFIARHEARLPEKLQI